MIKIYNVGKSINGVQLLDGTQKIIEPYSNAEISKNDYDFINKTSTTFKDKYLTINPNKDKKYKYFVQGAGNGLILSVIDNLIKTIKIEIIKKGKHYNTDNLTILGDDKVIKKFSIYVGFENDYNELDDNKIYYGQYNKVDLIGYKDIENDIENGEIFIIPHKYNKGKEIPTNLKLMLEDICDEIGIYKDTSI